jgi:hypothetical protein
MRNFTIPTVVYAGLSAAVLGLAAPAVSAPTGAANAERTIAELESRGYTVIVHRLSDSPLDQAAVLSVGEGPTFSHTESGVRNRDDYTGHDRQFAPMNQRTIYVTVR